MVKLSKEDFKGLRLKYGYRISTEMIREAVKVRGGILTDNSVINGESKFEVVCENGHVWKTTWHSIYVGKWCPYCANNKVDESYVIEFIKAKGGILSEDFKYTKSCVKFFVTCSNNHRFETYWSNIQAGHWCPLCHGNEIDESNIKKYVLSMNGKLDDEFTYENNTTSFYVLCENNHRFKSNWLKMQRGYWCPICSKNKVDELEVIKLIENKKGILDNGWKYENGRLKFTITCSVGHRFKTCWSYIQRGKWCPDCAGHVIEESFVKKVIENKGGFLDDSWKYTNSSTKFWITCKKGHRFESYWDTIKDGCWCPYCLYKTQEEFRSVISNFFGEPFPSSRPKWLLNKKGNRLQLDGYNEKLGIAFEYQGFQHYKTAHYDKYNVDEFEKRKEHDAIKREVCRKNIVTLIVVPYYIPKKQWTDLIKNEYYYETEFKKAA